MYLESLHQARKERLRRIARAAFKPVVIEETPASVDDQQVAILEWVERQIAVAPPVPPAVPHVKVEDIQRACGKHFFTSRAALVSPDRHKEITYPRHIAMYLSKSLTLRSFPEIGRRFGGRDHTTVIHGVKKIKDQLKTDWQVAYDVAHVEALL